jgi:2-polyprenyl-3-methyl-5-hydroxy-6-metoxy-1,4-benzoquinol methylase
VTQVIRRLLRRLTRRPTRRVMGRPAKTRAELHDFWRDPDPANRAERYLDAAERSKFLVELVARHEAAPSKVLEVGCNVGRNLDYLYRAGYHVAGIEISQTAVSVLRATFPEMAADATIYNAPVEEVIRTLPTEGYDVVFTMAVLEHIHPDSEWIFAEMARISRVVVTIEDEVNTTLRHFPRPYGEIFTALGLEQVESVHCSAVDGLGDAFWARVFRRAGSQAALTATHAIP